MNTCANCQHFEEFADWEKEQHSSNYQGYCKRFPKQSCTTSQLYEGNVEVGYEWNYPPVAKTESCGEFKQATIPELPY